MSLRPETKPDPDSPDGGLLMNASMMVEVARRVSTPQGDEFLRRYHEAEARIAGERPDLSEEAIRDGAARVAYRSMTGRGITDR